MAEYLAIVKYFFEIGREIGTRTPTRGTKNLCATITPSPYQYGGIDETRTRDLLRDRQTL